MINKLKREFQVYKDGGVSMTINQLVDAVNTLTEKVTNLEKGSCGSCKCKEDTGGILGSITGRLEPAVEVEQEEVIEIDIDATAAKMLADSIENKIDEELASAEDKPDLVIVDYKDKIQDQQVETPVIEVPAEVEVVDTVTEPVVPKKTKKRTKKAKK